MNYKDEKTVGRAVTEQGKILPRRMTGVCARHQRQIGTAVKRARYLALLPFVKGYGE
ncbi:MAG TPA: 30S ribosomal protein S18 [Longimicrobiales bacterium]